MNRRYLILFLIVFANFLGGTIVLPTLPLYTQRHFDARPETISLLLASYFIAQFFAAPILGRISDRVGRLPVLMISQIGTFVSFLMLGGAQSLTMLFAARILDGFTGGNVIVAQAYVTDITTAKQRTRGLGIIFAAFGLGYTIGPAVGGLVAGIFDDRAPFWIGAGISLATVILTWLFLDESLTPERRAQQRQPEFRMHVNEITSNIPLLLILVTGFGAQFSIAIMQATLALYGEAVLFAGDTPQQVSIGVGVMLTGIGVGQFFTQLVLVKPVVGYLGERRAVFFGAFSRAMAMTSIALFTSPFLVGGVSLIMIAVSSGIMMPSLQSLATQSVRETISGAVLGVYNAATSLGIIFGTALGGHLFAITPQTPFLVSGAVLFMTMLPALGIWRSLSLAARKSPAVA